MTNRVLILTAHADDADILTKALSRAEDGPFKIEWIQEIAAGLERLRKADIDAILVDLSIAGGGLDTFDKLLAAAPQIPIMTLSAVGEEALAREAVERGSQGYLTRGSFTNSLVPQALRSIIQRKAIEETLYRETSRANTVLDSIGDAVVCTDTSAKIEYLNPAGESLTGWPETEAIGRPIEEVLRLVNKKTRKPEPSPILRALKDDRPMLLAPNTVMIRRDGSEISIEDSATPIRDRAGRTTGAVMVFHDVTAAMAISEKMTHQAQHDILTDLPNRALLNDRTAQAIAFAKRNATQVSMLFLDLDQFKSINDSLGHAIGDKLLQSVAKRLLACVRGSDTVSRQGGDEFAVLLAEGNYDKNALVIAGKVLESLALPHSIDGHDLTVTASVGISIYPADGADPETLIKSADTAMYHAKEKGRNNCQFFTDEMNNRLVERRRVEASLRRALENQEFLLHYQSKVNLETGTISGAEALLRWSHPEWGLVSPGRFIPVAEESGLIVPIGHWVLGEACTQAKRWLDEGLALGTIAVNISALELRQENFVEGLREVLHETGLEARFLQLEITESVLMDDAEANSAILRQIKDIGVQLAVDDFGTGYSSLSYLTRFPIDILKIDQSFVGSIQVGLYDGIIAGAVIGMGNSLKLNVIAEGIENQAQLAFLRKRHCEEGQGYLFSRPLPADQFATLLADGLPARSPEYLAAPAPAT